MLYKEVLSGSLLLFSSSSFIIKYPSSLLHWISRGVRVVEVIPVLSLAIMLYPHPPKVPIPLKKKKLHGGDRQTGTNIWEQNITPFMFACFLKFYKNYVLSKQAELLLPFMDRFILQGALVAIVLKSTLNGLSRKYSSRAFFFVAVCLFHSLMF